MCVRKSAARVEPAGGGRTLRRWGRCCPWTFSTRRTRFNLYKNARRATKSTRFVPRSAISITTTSSSHLRTTHRRDSLASFIRTRERSRADPNASHAPAVSSPRPRSPRAARCPRAFLRRAPPRARAFGPAIRSRAFLATRGRRSPPAARSSRGFGEVPERLRADGVPATAAAIERVHQRVRTRQRRARRRQSPRGGARLAPRRAPRRPFRRRAWAFDGGAAAQAVAEGTSAYSYGASRSVVRDADVVSVPLAWRETFESEARFRRARLAAYEASSRNAHASRAVASAGTSTSTHVRVSFPPTRRIPRGALGPRDRVQARGEGLARPDACRGLGWVRLRRGRDRPCPAAPSPDASSARRRRAHRGERVFRDDVRHGTHVRGNRAPDATEREQQQAVRVFHRGRLSRRPQRPMDYRHAQSPSRVTECCRSSTIREDSGSDSLE